MKIVPASEVWGIGSRTAAKLNQLGINTFWDLASQPVDKIRDHFTLSLPDAGDSLRSTLHLLHLADFL